MYIKMTESFTEYNDSVFVICMQTRLKCTIIFIYFNVLSDKHTLSYYNCEARCSNSA